MRIAVVYDCLYPYTVGGAERWYRCLADHLAKDNDVDFVTRDFWGPDEPTNEDFNVVTVSRAGELYTDSGRRSILPGLRYGWGVFLHFLRNPHRYEIVSTASIPSFGLLATWLALKLRRSNTKLIDDWFEYWTKEYWIEYLGPLAGRIGFFMQSLAMRSTDASITFSEAVVDRLHNAGHRKEIFRLPGLYDGPTDIKVEHMAANPPYVIFLGRLIPEKRAADIPAAIASARQQIPNLRAKIYGDGPDRPAIQKRISELHLETEIECPGFVEQDIVERSLARALCLLNPSIREGYGLVVVEAAARGVPIILRQSPDSAATELVDNGVNGYIAESGNPDVLAANIVKVSEAGDGLRKSTHKWFRSNLDWLPISVSAEKAEKQYFKLLKR